MGRRETWASHRCHFHWCTAATSRWRWFRGRRDRHSDLQSHHTPDLETKVEVEDRDSKNQTVTNVHLVVKRLHQRCFSIVICGIIPPHDSHTRIQAKRELQLVSGRHIQPKLTKEIRAMTYCVNRTRAECVFGFRSVSPGWKSFTHPSFFATVTSSRTHQQHSSWNPTKNRSDTTVLHLNYIWPGIQSDTHIQLVD